MRLDVLLHALRLAKSRSQATAAIQAGEVRLNGERSKPSQAVRAGDRLTLITPHGERTLEVLELPTRPLSKEAARALWRERPGS